MSKALHHIILFQVFTITKDGMKTYVRGVFSGVLASSHKTLAILRIVPPYCHVVEQ